LVLTRKDISESVSNFVARLVSHDVQSLGLFIEGLQQEWDFSLSQTAMDRKHATYIIFHPKSLVSLLMHLCHMLLELGNWYRHSAMWHWECYATIKLFPVHASTEVAYLRYQLHW